MDLLFFHTEQLRYVVIELKTGAFEPAFTGQLGFYVAVVDDTMRRDFHRPTVGIDAARLSAALDGRAE
ncbi:MAG: PDDEXK nuclease domain-containing protein [Herbiconiux sp.]|nr:PDDEXK nuclease domain-containing protein [Herbiconiux sp.]